MSTPASSTGASWRSRHRTHHRPVLYSAEKFERHEGGMDPAAREEAAHASARILLMRGRGTDEQMTERLVSFTDDYGIEMLAESGRTRAPTPCRVRCGACTGCGTWCIVRRAG